MSNEYNIKSVNDFLSVPLNRIDDCLSEFKEFLELAHELKAMAATIGELTGSDGSSDVTGFVWIDDGKRDKIIRLNTELRVSPPAEHPPVGTDSAVDE